LIVRTALETEGRRSAGGRQAAESRATAGSLRSEHQGAVIGAAVALGLLVAGAFLVVSELRGTDFVTLTKDPVAAGGLDFETGILSRIGVVIWVATAASAVMAGFIAQRLQSPGADVLLSFGLLGVVMAVDDSLMIHEAVSSFTGLPLVEFGYVVAVVVILWRLRAEILSQTPWLVLAASFTGLALSEVVDFLDDQVSLGAGAGVEDVCKFIGILLFAAYLLLMARRTVIASAPRASA
jgi:hypothetical protein